MELWANRARVNYWFDGNRHGRWFKTRLFGKIHIFVPNPEGARTIFANDFVLFNKGYVKSMADAVGKKSLLCVPVESHKRIRRLLSEPFSMTSLSAFVTTFDKMLSARLQKLEKSGKSFKVLDFCMKVKTKLWLFSVVCYLSSKNIVHGVHFFKKSKSVFWFSSERFNCC